MARRPSGSLPYPVSGMPRQAHLAGDEGCNVLARWRVDHPIPGEGERKPVGGVGEADRTTRSRVAEGGAPLAQR